MDERERVVWRILAMSVTFQKVADAEKHRAREATARGIGDPNRLLEKRDAQHGDVFGAGRRLQLREQLNRSRMTSPSTSGPSRCTPAWSTRRPTTSSSSSSATEP